MSIFNKARLLYSAIAAMLGAQSHGGQMEVLGRPTRPSPRRSRHKQVSRNFTNSKNHFRTPSGTGPRECARRIRQIFGSGKLVHAFYVGPDKKLRGKGALLRRDGGVLFAQLDDLNHEHSNGWWEYQGAHFAIGH